jgi:hypothetical protein
MLYAIFYITLMAIIVGSFLAIAYVVERIGPEVANFVKSFIRWHRNRW